MEQNILIVEDQKRLAQALVAILERDGLTADAVYDGHSGLEYARSDIYDAVVLDVMLPGIDGFEIIRTLRREGNDVPVIMLTARDTLGDKVSGLDFGADDYLTKPFQPAELLARLRALTRRTGTVVSQALAVGNTVLDLETADLSVTSGAGGGAGGAAAGGDDAGSAGAGAGFAASGASATGGTDDDTKSVHLSQREFDVLQVLMANPGQTISKARLLERIWGMDSDADENSVEAYISFTRKKLAFLGSNLKITTLRMLGYRLEVDNG